MCNSAGSDCESGRLLACELQKTRFIFDRKNNFNKPIATQFLSLTRLRCLFADRLRL